MEATSPRAFVLQQDGHVKLREGSLPFVPTSSHYHPSILKPTSVCEATAATKIARILPRTTTSPGSKPIISSGYWGVSPPMVSPSRCPQAGQQLSIVKYPEFLDVLSTGQLVVRQHRKARVACDTTDDLNNKTDDIVAHSAPPEQIPEEARQTKDTAKEWVEELQKKYPDKIVKAISFSDTELDHYLPLGVDDTAPVLSRSLANERIMGLVVDNIESRNPLESVKNTRAEKRKAGREKPVDAGERTGFTIRDAIEEFPRRRTLIQRIEQVNISSDGKPEAFAREIIDLFLAEMIQLLLKMELGVFKATEFRIASQADAVEVSNGKFLTALTGVVDYALFSKQKLSRSDLSELRAFWDINKPEGTKTLLGKTRSEGIHILLIEAKRKEYSQSLRSCMPQIVAECIATMKLSGASAMRWCLSTGSSWVFGVICDKSVGGEYRVYSIKPMEYAIDALDDSANISVIQDIFWALVCWSMVPVDKIIEKVFNVVEPNGC